MNQGSKQLLAWIVLGATLANLVVAVLIGWGVFSFPYPFNMFSTLWIMG